MIVVMVGGWSKGKKVSMFPIGTGYKRFRTAPFKEIAGSHKAINLFRWEWDRNFKVCEQYIWRSHRDFGPGNWRSALWERWPTVTTSVNHPKKSFELRTCVNNTNMDARASRLVVCLAGGSRSGCGLALRWMFQLGVESPPACCVSAGVAHRRRDCHYRARVRRVHRWPWARGRFLVLRERSNHKWHWTSNVVIHHTECQKWRTQQNACADHDPKANTNNSWSENLREFCVQRSFSEIGMGCWSSPEESSAIEYANKYTYRCPRARGLH